ncbi:unnamed protein product, partial [marine sediment metagenome]
ISWRTMFTQCSSLWHDLSNAEKQSWESAARPLHMTGYAWYISQCLRPNPGIYLPLAGGTMSGNIDMDTLRILKLPAPVADEEPSRKSELDTLSALVPTLIAAHALLSTGVHGVSTATVARRTLGNYSGDDTANRAITHGLGANPVLVFLVETAGSGRFSFFIRGRGLIFTWWTGGNSAIFVVNGSNANDFYVGNAANYTDSANALLHSYYWVAFA